MNLNSAIEVKIVWIGTNKLCCDEYISYTEGNAVKYAKRKIKYKKQRSPKIESMGNFESIGIADFNNVINGQII